MKWVVRLAILAVVGFVGFFAYDLQRGGYYSMPELADGAYPISFKSGFRAIVQDVEVSEPRYTDSHWIVRRLASANPDRRYIGIPSEVPRWFEDTWSTCRPPSEEEQQAIEASYSDDVRAKLYGARFDAVCFIETDNEQKVIRGVIYSVPQT